MNRIRSQGLLSARFRRTPLAIRRGDLTPGGLSRPANCPLASLVVHSTMGRSFSLGRQVPSLEERRMRPAILGLLATILVLSRSVPAAAAEEPLVKQVGQAIEKGKTYLLGVGKDKGNWEVDTLSATQEGGWTSLALLALLNAGVPPDDPVIQKGLTFLVRIKPKNTYVVGLQTMVLALVDKDNRYKDQIQGNVNWLVEARIRSDGKLLGWGYGAGDNHGSVNNSNTQYVLLGLHEGMNAGATVAPGDLKEIQEFYMKAEPDGGWGYHRGEDSTLTMTSAGVCGLLITGMDLNAGREKPLAGGKFAECGKYTENKNVLDGLKWI